MQEPNFCASSSAVSSADAIAALCSVGTRMVFMHTPHMPPAQPAGRLPLAGYLSRAIILPRGGMPDKRLLPGAAADCSLDEREQAKKRLGDAP